MWVVSKKKKMPQFDLYLIRKLNIYYKGKDSYKTTNAHTTYNTTLILKGRIHNCLSSAYIWSKLVAPTKYILSNGAKNLHDGNVEICNS